MNKPLTNSQLMFTLTGKGKLVQINLLDPARYTFGKFNNWSAIHFGGSALMAVLWLLILGSFWQAALVTFVCGVIWELGQVDGDTKPLSSIKIIYRTPDGENMSVNDPTKFEFLDIIMNSFGIATGLVFYWLTVGGAN